MFRVDALTKSFKSSPDAVTALNNINLVVGEGELVVLLGPSGCGKTTALRCLAGLESADEGRITFGDRVVYDSNRRIDVPPEKRNVGMVFQSYALWPHKTVRANIEYPLRMRKLKQEIQAERWVEQVAELVDCSRLLDRYPAQLSGGQQQRVALARGIVSRPDLVLFDEPLSNLDSLLRAQVRNELHELHARLGFAGVYVTHDHGEAFALGDRLVIMRAGGIEQIGSPQDIYESPASEFVANFVGLTNRITAGFADGVWHLEGGRSPDQLNFPPAIRGDTVSIRFRPEQSSVVDSEVPGERLCLPAEVIDSVYAGSHDDVTVSVGNLRLTSSLHRRAGRKILPGDPIWVSVPWAACTWYDSEGNSLKVRDAAVFAEGTDAR